ncbi:hypothetical protein [Thalassococcus lentus]|uniref:D-galactarate dehydratase n=1 Tax=Thalassococcus lentus TaxID=1210524 RepID=A0ABT4XTI8_9RHOB|nr:hypothetical protein [Thalassococcus lentus]MDA7425284.1 hypothetical protein [Thalassococcus lentus]
MRAVFLSAAILAIAGCTQGPLGKIVGKPSDDGAVSAAQPADGQIRPQARPGDLDTTTRVAPPPPRDARTAEEFDTTTAAERQEAAAAPAEPAGERSLGTTVASLGDVAKPGFWLETPLVKQPGKGRVFYPASGKSAQVDLIPIDGPATGGSRISLAAMRLIEAPLTELPTLQVFTGG